MIILKVALGVLAVGVLEFLGLFLWCLFVDLKHKKNAKDKEEKSEI